MLNELLIENLTLVEKLHLDLRDGFVCVTGETGAGKSALIHSLSLLAGSKADKGRIRLGSKKLRVEGHFELPNTSEYTEWFEKNELEFESFSILSREVNSNGSSRARVNGTVVPLGAFQELGSKLVQLHGQSEQVRLKDIKFHLKWLDQFAVSQNHIADYYQTYKELTAIEKRIEKLKSDFANKDQQSDFLKFQLKELQAAELVLGEDDEIRQELEGMENSAELLRLKNKALEIMQYDKANVQNVVANLTDTIVDLEEITPELKGWGKKLDELNAEFENLNQTVHSIKAPEDLSLIQIDKYNSRLSKLQRLQRKYKTDLRGLIELEQERANDIEMLKDFDGQLEGLYKEKVLIESEIQTKGTTLSDFRKSKALDLDQKINNLLQKLGMSGSKFRTDIIPLEAPSSTGLDRVEFFITPNAGEGERALKSTLSGGELSRIMLSLKTVLADKDEIPVLVFDEVDSGISGEVAHSIAECLVDLGKYHQVFSITHLHQVASKGNHHLVVSKTSTEDRTLSTIDWVEENDRITEIARMLGDSNSEQTLEHAKTLLSF
jgi:DNA repair protein RecN (Recombination protein N)